MSETSQLVSPVVRLLNCIPGVKAMRNNTGGKKGGKMRWGLGTGSADIIVCVDGMFLALEAKLPGEPIRTSQVKWSNEITRAGGWYLPFTTVKQALDAVANIRKSRQAWLKSTLRGGQNG